MTTSALFSKHDAQLLLSPAQVKRLWGLGRGAGLLEAPARRHLAASSSTRLQTSSTAVKDHKEDNIIDAVASPGTKQRLPALSHQGDEFPCDGRKRQRIRRQIRRQSLGRITRNAFVRVLEPPTLHLLAAAAVATLGVGAVEGSLMCVEGVTSSWESLQFVVRYSLEQLFPSVVWQSQDPALVATALQLDPAVVLRDLSGTTPESARLLLQTNLLASSRHFWAGFMMIAQLVRAATITMDSFDQYQEQIKLGRESPLFLDDAGLVVRLCGIRSHVSEVSLSKMKWHLFPVLEDPESVQFLVRKHSQNYRRPVYWWILPGMYGASDAWKNLPTDRRCFLQGRNKDDPLVVLEADATNGNDPLALGETSLDLTIDDAAQGFRRILDRYSTTGGLVPHKDFRTLRVYLGNSMETQKTGGGHSYTMRHRVQYAKEVDVLVDSRAPVLEKILSWCDSVAFRDRKIFFQTSSRAYFLNLQQLLKQYGYDIYDPLDLRAIKKELKDEDGGTNVQQQQQQQHKNNSFLSTLLQDRDFVDQWWEENASFFEDIAADYEKQQEEKDDTSMKNLLGKIASAKKLPTLIHMRTTAETVNSVEALILAGEVDARNCCVLIDRHDGVQALEHTLKTETEYVPEAGHTNLWSRATTLFHDAEDSDKEMDLTTTTTRGLQIVCSSSIHDNLFREVRQWARMGYSAADIQAEFDARYQDTLQRIHSVQQEVKKTNGAEFDLSGERVDS